MYTIKTLNAISPVGLAKLPANQFEIDNEAAAPQGILVRSADMHDTPLPDSLLAIARAGAGTNNIPVEDCTNKGIVVFNTPGANANAVKELVIAGLLISSRMSTTSQFFSFFGYCLGAGVGFTAALLILWSVRSRLSLTRIPKIFRGFPITFLCLGILSLALFGLLGNQLPA